MTSAAVPGLGPVASRESKSWAKAQMYSMTDGNRSFREGRGGRGDAGSIPIRSRDPATADIMVSELLGSFGDNELSPECLDGAQKYLKPGGVSIPCSYTSYLAPISAAKLWNEARSHVRPPPASPLPAPLLAATLVMGLWAVEPFSPLPLQPPSPDRPTLHGHAREQAQPAPAFGGEWQHRRAQGHGDTLCGQASQCCPAGASAALLQLPAPVRGLAGPHRQFQVLLGLHSLRAALR